MTLPNFLIIGAAKSGTTSLYRYLGQHPEVFMSASKEPRFFALENDPLDYRGPGDPCALCEHKTLEAYTSLFAGAGQARAIGEASTLYLCHPDAAQNIRHHVPEMKLTAVLRNPVEQAYSNFVYLRRDGREPCDDFRDALALEAHRAGELRWGPLWHYTGRGFFGKQLERYYALFDREQIRVNLYEDLRADPVGLCQDIFDFLGVARDFRPDVSVNWNISGLPRNRWLHRFLKDPRRLRTAAGRLLPEATKNRITFWLKKRNLTRAPALDPTVRAELYAVFRDDIAKLEDLIRRDLSSWKL